MNPIGPKQTFCLYTLSTQACFMTEAYFKSEISSILTHNPPDCKQQPKQLLLTIYFITLALAPFQINFLRKFINGFQQSQPYLWLLNLCWEKSVYLTQLKADCLCPLSSETEYRVWLVQLYCLQNIMSSFYPSRYWCCCSTPMDMYCYNQASIFISNNLMFHEHAKHIEVNGNFIRNSLIKKQIDTHHYFFLLNRGLPTLSF